MRDRKFEIEAVDLGVARPDTVRILIAQAFWPDSTFTLRHGLHFHRDPQPARLFCERILRKARLKSVQLVVFPELSIPAEILETVRLFSAETGTIVVAGSHYFESKKGWIARSPIYINGTAWFTEKISPSYIEQDANVGFGAEPGEKIYWFRNTSAGNFIVAICNDYLSHVHHQLPLDEIDILCLPVMQPRSDEYYPRMQIDCGRSVTGIYIAYANNVHRRFGDGHSALFAHMDREYLGDLISTGWTDGKPSCKAAELLTDSGYIEADLDLKTKAPLKAHSPDTRPNVRVWSNEDQQAERFAREIQLNDERYVRIRELFVPPSNYDTLLRKLETNKLLFIVGDPGIGKTYTAAHLLREYFDRGYSVQWHSGQEEAQRLHQRHALEQFRPAPNQIIHFEDPFGRTLVEPRDTVRRILGPLIDHLRGVDARVVITSRREVYQQFLDVSASTDELEALTEHLGVGIYSTASLRKILDNAGSSAKWFENPAWREAIATEIEQGRLATPLSIRHFVYSSEWVASIEVLRELLQRRVTEEQSLFVEEIVKARFRARLVLGLVFLHGAQPVATLAEWFNEVTAKHRPNRLSSGTAPILEALRMQIGYRLEQYGVQATVYRFIHRFYEEAFATAAMVHPETLEILRGVATVVARRNVRTGVDGIVRRAKKYPELAAQLLQAITPVIRADGDLFDLIQVCSSLLGLHAETHDVRFIDALEAIITLPQLIERVNTDPDVKRLGPALRLCFNYAWRLSKLGRLDRDWKGVLSAKLDWNAQETAWQAASTFSQQLEALWWATQIDRPRVEQYLSAIPDGTVRPSFAGLSQDEKERFLNIARKLPIARQLKPLAMAEPLRTKRERARKWLDSERNLTRGVVIDKGACTRVVRAERKSNLLPVGVIRTIGEFERNQAISIFDEGGNVLAAGVTNYSSVEISAIQGRHSSRRSEAPVPDHGAAIVPRDTIVTKTG